MTETGGPPDAARPPAERPPDDDAYAAYDDEAPDDDPYDDEGLDDEAYDDEAHDHGAEADEEPEARPSPWAPSSHHPVVLWAVLLKLAFGLLYTVAVPLYRGPDEAQHVDLLRQYRFELGYKDPSTAIPEMRAVYETEDVMGRGVPRAPQQEADALPRPDRPTFREIAPLGEQRGGNQLSTHPPLYYVTVGSVTSLAASLVPAEAWSWDREVLLYRLVSVLVTVPIAYLASVAALAIGLSRAAAAIAAAFLLLVPEESFLGGVVNNDVLMMTMAALAVAGTLHQLDPTASARGSTWAGAAGAAGAALSKATGALLLPWTVLLVAVGSARRFLAGARRQATVTAVVAGAIIAVGGSWYVTNVIRFRDAQPSRVGLALAGPEFEPRFTRFLAEWTDRVTSSFWGQPGRRTGVTLDWPVIHTLSGLTALCILVALFTRRAQRVAALSLVVLVAVQVALLFRTNYRSYLRYGGFHALQGRYLYSLLVPLAVLVALAFWRFLRRRPAGMLGVAYGMVAIGTFLHLNLAHSMLEGYWASPDASLAERLDALVAWSPLPAVLTRATFLLPFAVALAAAAAFAWRLSRRRWPPRSAARRPGPRPAATTC